MFDFDFNGDGKHDGFDDFMLFHLVNSSDEDDSSHTSGDSSGDFSGILAILLIILVISFFI